MFPISIQSAVNVILILVVGGIVFGLLDLLVRKAPFMPEGWIPIVRWVLLALAILVLIAVLLSFISGQPVFRT